MASINTGSPGPLPGLGSGTPTLKDRIPKLEPRRRRPATSSPAPLPKTPNLPSPPNPSKLSFRIPTRRIISKKDHDLFLSSSTYTLVLAFIFRLSESVADTPCSAVKDCDLRGPTRAILRVLEDVENLVMHTPPEEAGGSRFGNKAFRTFLDSAKEMMTEWHKRIGVDSPEAIEEVSAYLMQSFGNRARIDYGSGHELNFMIWLLCLYQLRLLSESDFEVLVLKVFTRYLDVMRLIQSTYYLEPAGSHGVWGLDDYQFLPFLFGASQLLHHSFITPLGIHQELTLEEFGSDYIYLGQVNFVNSTKTVKGLRWHSPMLDDISSAKSWAKIEVGMRRMFVAEVLNKLPVMQHFLFGSLVPALEGMSTEDEAGLAGNETPSHGSNGQDGIGHPHQHNGWGDCCGVKVPSSIAASEEMKKKGHGESFRRIPFD
jgi:serine/threonine-protein phosphatase 2A activator